MRITRLFACMGVLVMGQVAQSTPLPNEAEMINLRQWVGAKFEGRIIESKPAAGVVVLANHDPLQLNSRNGRPMKIGDVEYTRGLYCHAISKLHVRLPGRGKSLTAIVGVDHNPDTSGGRGSVVFSVSVAGEERFKSPIMRGGEPGIPTNVDLKGESDFSLNVSDAGDGIACDQADWADAKVTLEDGTNVWLGDLQVVDHQERPFTTDPFFSFVYDGKHSSTLLTTWDPARDTKKLDERRTQRTLTWTDPKTGLEVRCVAVEYSDFPTVEWTVYFKNTGTTDTPILSDIHAIDTRFERSGQGEFLLHHNRGTSVRPDDFEPLTTVLGPDSRQRLAPPGGRPCGGVWPYFNIEKPGGGAIVVVGWPGQWAASFERDGANGLQIRAGQELTHLKLRAGEEIRTPLTVIQFWSGDYMRSQNMWRRWMRTSGMPRPNGKLSDPLLTPCSSHWYAEMINANEENQKMFIDRYLEERMDIDYWWMDAGWYINKTGWPNTGTWEVDKTRFPNGLRAISDHAHSKGIKSLVWFEPERVTSGTWLADNHPKWLLQGTLLNLGNPDAWSWLVNHIDKIIVDEKIDLYRQDYNIDPLAYWRGADAEDRKGITENHYVTGYLAYWDELKRRHPGMLIDSCASGGHRNDLETMRRSLPFLRSDCIHNALANQGHTYGLSFWLPYHGTGSSQTNKYDLRSALSCTHFIACWDMRNRELDYDLFRKLIADWRQTAPVALHGDYYPLSPYSLDEDRWIAWQFHRPDTNEGYLEAFRHEKSDYEVARYPLKGLTAGADYTIQNLDTGEVTTMTAAEMMEHGVEVRIAEQRGSAIILYKHK